MHRLFPARPGLRRGSRALGKGGALSGEPKIFGGRGEKRRQIPSQLRPPEKIFAGKELKQIKAFLPDFVGEKAFFVVSKSTKKPADYYI